MLASVRSHRDPWTRIIVLDQGRVQSLKLISQNQIRLKFCERKGSGFKP